MILVLICRLSLYFRVPLVMYKRDDTDGGINMKALEADLLSSVQMRRFESRTE